MTKKETTPGPWKVVPYDGEAFNIITHIAGELSIIRADDGPVDLYGIEADARLIAAAPDLLKACEVAYDAINFSPHDVLLNSREERALELIETAIGKAEGENE